MLLVYTNGCPKCNMLKMQLDKHGVKFQTTDNFEKIIKEGHTSLPVVEHKGKLLKYDDAMKAVMRGEF